MELKDYYKEIEQQLRYVEALMRNIHPNFNSVRNAERFVHCCLKANEALRQMQRGNYETVTRYWGDENA